MPFGLQYKNLVRHAHTKSRRGIAGAALCVAGWTSVTSLGAQTPVGSARDTSEHEVPPTLFTVRDAYLAGAFALATVAFFPLDRQIGEELQDPETQTNRFFKNASTGFELIASPGAYVIGGSMYLVGRIGRYDRLTDLGWHGTEAVLLGDGITIILKGALGRARPSLSNASRPGDWRPFRGFGNGNRSSFPSGHTSTAFSAAAAVAAETSRWWPKSTWIVGPILYGGATMVGLSRMYHNRHWASDVALGAAVGTFSGLKVVRFTHAHPTNRIDRIMLRTALTTTTQGGLALRVTLPLP
jgi:membrane-associated phospholipid phosphatase